jgi:hypothetical protein
LPVRQAVTSPGKRSPLKVRSAAPPKAPAAKAGGGDVGGAPIDDKDDQRSAEDGKRLLALKAASEASSRNLPELQARAPASS